MEILLKSGADLKTPAHPVRNSDQRIAVKDLIIGQVFAYEASASNTAK
jgi:hypothetical protein